MKNLKIIFIHFLFTICIAGCTPEQTNLPSNDKPTEEVTPTITTSPVPTKETERPTEVNAVFYNNLISMHIPGASDDDVGVHTDYFVDKPEFLSIAGYDGTHNQIVSYYNVDEQSEQLYAFVVCYGKHEMEEPEDCPKLEDYGIPKDSARPTDYDAYKDYAYDWGLYKYNILLESMKKTDIVVVENYPYSYKGVRGLLVEHEFFYCTGTDGSAPVIIGTMEEIINVFSENNSVDGWYYQLVSAPRPDAVKIAREKGITDDITHSNFKEIFGDENQVEVTVNVQ